jgi:DNA-binding NarL/FixJ family response regulator
LRVILEADPAITVLADTGTRSGFVRALNRHTPDVLVLEAELSAWAPPAAAGDEHSATVVFGLKDAAPEELVALVQGEVSGVVHRDAPHQELVDAVHRVAAGHCFASQAFTDTMVRALRSRPPQPALDRAADVRLTVREVEVLELVCRGLSNREIARSLSVGEKTVKFHVSNILAKHSVRTRAQLIVGSAALRERAAV